MTHKRKKPGAHVIVHSSDENSQTQQNTQQTGLQILGRARSLVNSAGQFIANNYLLIAGIGIAAGTVAYLAATEGGRSVTTKIVDTAETSFNDLKQDVVDRFEQLKDSTMDLIQGQAELDQEFGEEQQAPRLRRVG